MNIDKLTNSTIVVLGDGILGTEIVKQTGWDYISRKKDNFDIRNYDSYYDFFLQNYGSIVGESKYKTIINCISHTDTYSNCKELHWDINFKSVVKLSDFCSHHKIELVHISTDYVYTNSVSNASEDDIPIHGNNWYSYTKLLGDSYVQLNENNLILRGTHKKNPFPYLNAWIDQIGNFDYVISIFNSIVHLTKNDFEIALKNIHKNLKNCVI